MSNTADLLEEIAALKATLVASEARNIRKDARIERLQKRAAAFQQAAFGRRSEKSDLFPGNRLPAKDERADQFELALEVEPLSGIGPRTMARRTDHRHVPCRRGC